ncbi:MAG: hypothetical protein JSV16_17280 [Candidatus Hydrogenedentota bacterium]|nr:MAG: hypothetical protein JSV16_17280 [Candidatus Hydrogenedentota bacterium]
MTNRSNLLLVSANPELHRTLEIIASTYNFRFLGTEKVKTGASFFKSHKLECVIFDLEVLPDYRQRVIVKKELVESGVPILFLNDNGNGVQYQDEVRTPLKIEPIVKFVLDVRGGLHQRSNGGILNRLLSLCRFRRA